MFLLRQNYNDEKNRLIREANFTVNAGEKHTSQIVKQVDVLIHAVRMVYYHHRSISETEQFINRLNFDTAIIENIFLVRADGTFIIPHDKSTKLLNAGSRDYFDYHRTVSTDHLFISAVEQGIITQQYRFRITRRINKTDGSFGGVIIVTVNPHAFTHYYQELKMGGQWLTSLMGTVDKKLRARIPEPAEDKWNIPVEIPANFAALEKAGAGSLEIISSVDNIKRIIMYKKVGQLPLAMLVGFSEADVQDGVFEKRKWLILIETMGIIFILLITSVLIVVIISRDKLTVANQKLNQLYSQLQELALYDSLTGLPNRILFSDRLKYALLTAERNNEYCMLMFIDLDGFKDINDKYGHDMGDEVLKFVANRMQKVLRITDTVCRWGGDEFLILLPKVEDRQKVTEIAELLLTAIKKPFNCQGADCRVSASIGIAGFPVNGRTTDTLKKAADSAMYQAKKQGKDQAVFAVGLNEHDSNGQE